MSTLSYVYLVTGPTTDDTCKCLGVFGGRSQAIIAARKAIDNGEFISITVKEMELGRDYISLANLQTQVKTWENV